MARDRKPPRRTHRPTFPPKYRRLRRRSGRDLAFVEVDGRRVYLGPYDTPESRERYHRVVAEWEANARTLPPAPAEITVVEHAAHFMRWARGYYVKHDRVTAEPENIALALRPLQEVYGHTPAAQFGPRALKAVRQGMVQQGWTRRYINKHVDRIKRMFKWAAAEELVPPSAYQGLRAVAGLKYGCCGAPDNPPVQPVPEELIEPVKRHVARQVAAMIDLHLLTGARPGEIVSLRPSDIDQSGPVWAYRPARHKTEHHGHERVIFLGPQAQKVLRPFLLRPQGAYCFSPAQADAELRAVASAARITPLSCGNRPGTNRNPKPGRKPGDRCPRDSYPPDSREVRGEWHGR